MLVENYLIYLLLVISLPLLAQVYLRTSISKYSKVSTNRGLSGYDVAKRILNDNGLDNVKIEMIKQNLGDHYDPRTKTVRLSKANYYGSSVTAISIAAHECGHAVQDAESYLFLTFRKALVPVVNFSSRIAWVVIMIGFFTASPEFVLIGIVAIFGVVLFQFVTLPVEFNASSRAVILMSNSGILERTEETGVKKVLNAAALTYVAATAVSILELLRLVMIYNNMSGRRR